MSLAVIIFRTLVPVVKYSFDASSDGGSVPIETESLTPTDVIHDVMAAMARNDSGDPAWADVHQVTEGVISIFTANLNEIDGGLHMESIEYWKALDVMQLNATGTKVKFNEHVDNGRWPLC